MHHCEVLLVFLMEKFQKYNRSSEPAGTRLSASPVSLY